MKNACKSAAVEAPHEYSVFEGEPADSADSLLKTIDLFGYAVVAAHIDGPYGELSVSFTVGLSRLGLPELLTCALPEHVAQEMLSTSAERIRTGNLPVDVSLGEIADSMNVIFKVAATSKLNEINLAIEALAGVDNPVVLQMVWPDKSGLFPWDIGFDERLKSCQANLYETS